MAGRRIQISIDTKLLERIDRDPQTREQGRSAFIRDAVELYLAANRRRDAEPQIVAAFRDAADDLRVEAEGWLKEQSWPEEAIAVGCD